MVFYPIHGTKSGLYVSSTCGHNVEPTPYSSGLQHRLIPRYVTAVPWNHPADYFVDKVQIIFWTSHFRTRNSVGDYNTVGVADPQFVIFNMTYIFLVLSAISVFVTICWIIWTDMWPLIVETRTFLSTQWWPLRYFARRCIATFPRIHEQRVDRTRPQSGWSVYWELLQSGHMDGTRLGWWKTTGREAFFLIFFLYLPCWKLSVRYL